MSKRTERTDIVVTKELKQRIKAQAQKEALSVSSFLRRIAVLYLDKVEM